MGEFRVSEFLKSSASSENHASHKREQQPRQSKILKVKSTSGFPENLFFNPTHGILIFPAYDPSGLYR
jgi:hypothetical protein